MLTLTISYKQYRFPPEIITHSVWLYCRFNLNFREVEEMLLERGIDVSYETVVRWVTKFGLLSLVVCADSNLDLATFGIRTKSLSRSRERKSDFG